MHYNYHLAGYLRMGKKTIYLHVGYHKTGTTYIQVALMQNASELARKGILYYQDPKYAGQWFSNHTLALSIRQSRHETIDMTEHPEQVWSRFLRDVASFKGDRILVSSEVFMEGVDKEFIRKKLSDYTIRLVFYVREQSQVIGSLYSERVKHGYAEDIEDYFKQTRDETLDYFSELERWAAIFGRENIIVRDFDRITQQGNLLQDILSLLEVCEKQFVRLKMPQQNLNIRYPAHLVELLLAFNKLPIVLNEKIKFRYYLDSILNRRADIASMPRFEVDEELQREVKSYCLQSNKKLSEKYAPDGVVFFE